MVGKFLMLNSDKTKVILLGQNIRDQLSGDLVSLNGIALASSTTNLVVIYDQNLSLST